MKILYVTTVGITMIFFKTFIKQLIDEGHIVDIATNETDYKVDECYKKWGCKIYPLSCSRTPFNVGAIKAINEIRKIVKENGYELVHCHTPIAAMSTRIACRSLRKKGVRVFYSAHGFHFYKGAPLKNWLFYYPVEKICSYFTDVLITINQEDYALAKKKMKAKQIEYVPGVGIDVSRFKNTQVNKIAKRQKIGVPEDAFLLFSVGELNENKNHQIIIKAMSKLNNPNVHYAIAGIGDKRECLLAMAEELGLSKHVHLLGYRKDVPELNYISDVFCFPSYREGLPVALMEAMVCGLPVVCSDIRGNNDLIQEGQGGFLCEPKDISMFAEKINELSCNIELREQMRCVNLDVVKSFSIDNVNKQMQLIYEVNLNEKN